MDQAAYEERMHNQADYNVKLELVLAKIAETEALRSTTRRAGGGRHQRRGEF